jgi:hypothetical protein
MDDGDSGGLVQEKEKGENPTKNIPLVRIGKKNPVAFVVVKDKT